MSFCTKSRATSILAFGVIVANLTMIAIAQSISADGPKKPAVAFDRDIRPILSNYCFSCHGQDASARKARLRLDQKDLAFGRLRSGAMGIVPGKPMESEVYRRIIADDPSERMPPAHGGKPLTPQQVELMRRWIEDGAEWKSHWAFSPVGVVTVPTTKNRDWARNDIDSFVLARLEQEGLIPSPEADRTTLIRRLSLDLTGLPPSIREVDNFVADRSPKAYERLVDRLLQSSHYGERMASAWLDGARYADSAGQNYDHHRTSWVYRDWVVRAFNANMPFDRFTLEQLAGDLLPSPTLDQLVATSFNRFVPMGGDGNSADDIQDNRNRIIADQVNTTASVFLGLTFNCAQCHDHRYDPISQADYYRLYAFFNKQSDDIANPLRGNNQGNQLPVVDVPWTDGEAKMQFSAMVMKDAEPDRATHILIRGDFKAKGEKVAPGVPAFLGVPLTTSNRLGLARWLTDPRHPLTSRVIVNRLWEQLFGVALVKTTENLGNQGEPPSNQALLDWLAHEFVARKWDVKAMQRLMVLSATYRQSSRVTKELAARDPDNRLLARQSRRRLSAEFLRDNALAISGLLDPVPGGAPLHPRLTPNQIELYNQKRGPGGALAYGASPHQYRRSLYVHYKRSLLYLPFALFDAPTRETCVIRRARTNTPLQALALFNEPLYVDAAHGLTQRIKADGGATVKQRLQYAFQCCCARQPTPAELRILTTYFEHQRDDFTANLQAARQVLEGRATLQSPADLAETAAWVLTCGVLLNMDETITRE